ncbi:MAG: hypothetical protein KGQ60_20145, partial [Planctomycetes bacterium]|nr:hypothetical protein [Planctomycetota bacterium]
QIDFERTMERLLAIRSSLAIASNPTPTNPSPSIFQLDSFAITQPQSLLSAYSIDRQKSELARVFALANYWHSRVDRVVVLADEPVVTAIQSVLGVCCQPYWNEFSRAERGSKPRLYLDGYHHDNDCTQGLLHLLSTPRDRQAIDEIDRWALIDVSTSESSTVHGLLVDRFLAELRDHLGSSQIPDPFFCQLHEGKASKPLGENHFVLPACLRNCLLPFTPAVLLPAALLGINVMELLFGAMTLSNHFLSTGPEENLVLQWVAINILFRQIDPVAGHMLRLWHPNMRSFGCWTNELFSRALPSNYGFRMAYETQSLGGAKIDKQPSHVVHQLFAKETRFDSLHLLDGNSMQQYRSYEFEVCNRRIDEQGGFSTLLTLPTLDELHLGQLLQWMIIAAIIEERNLHFHE